MKLIRNKMFKNKKAMDWLSIISILAVIAIGLYVLAKSRTSFAESAQKYSSEEFGDFADTDNDGIINLNDQCPAKACDPRLVEQAGQAGALEKNPNSERSGCTETQVPCGMSMECRQATTC